MSLRARSVLAPNQQIADGAQTCGIERGYCVCDMPDDHPGLHHCRDCGATYDSGSIQQDGADVPDPWASDQQVKGSDR